MGRRGVRQFKLVGAGTLLLSGPGVGPPKIRLQTGPCQAACAALALALTHPMQLAGQSCVKLFAREVVEAVPLDPSEPRRIFATSRGTRFERAWIQVRRGTGGSDGELGSPGLHPTGLDGAWGGMAGVPGARRACCVADGWPWLLPVPHPPDGGVPRASHSPVFEHRVPSRRMKGRASG